MKCVICEETAKWRWSPDLDIQGIGSCDIHKDTVQDAYICLVTGSEDMYNAIINRARKQLKEATKPRRCACAIQGVRNPKFTKHSKYECSNDQTGVLRA